MTRPTRREFLRRLTASALAAPVVGSLGSCTAKAGQGGTTDDDLGPIEKDLSLYLWSDYLADTTVPEFEREFGVRVTVDTYESNEEMAAKLIAGASGYDVVLPSSYLFPLFHANRLALPLNRKYLGNWSNVAPLFVNPSWDPGNRISVPWAWGTTGIAYRRDLVDAPPTSWAVFHDARYRGKMTMLDDYRDVIGSFLKFRGRSLNSVDPSELEQAKADALAAKPNLKAYLSGPVKSQLIAGDVVIAQLWNGDASQAIAEQPEIGFVVPEEGSMIFADALVVLANAPHKRAAHEFLNYILRPEVAAAISDKTGYGSANHAAVPLTRAKVPYPTEADLARLEYQTDLGGGAELWDRIWTEIKSG